MTRTRSKAGAAVVAAVVAITVTGGAAFAYWTASGDGAGNASVGTMTLTGSVVSGGDSAGLTTLYPGQNGDAILRVINPNAFTVKVTAIQGPGPVTASCGTPGVTFTAPTDFSAAQYTLAANGASTLLTLADAMYMDDSSTSDCQGKTFSLPVTVTVQQ